MLTRILAQISSSLACFSSDNEEIVLSANTTNSIVNGVRYIAPQSIPTSFRFTPPLINAQNPTTSPYPNMTIATYVQPHQSSNSEATPNNNTTPSSSAIVISSSPTPQIINPETQRS